MKKYYDDGTCIILPDNLVKFIENYHPEPIDFFEDTVWEYVPQIEKEE